MQYNFVLDNWVRSNTLCSDEKVRNNFPFIRRCGEKKRESFFRISETERKITETRRAEKAYKYFKN